MAIFQNEAIRSLPEQVEKNKEDIKNINDILENIDPDQVATILSDIASIKAEQVVQNTAINSNAGNITANTTAINNEKTERESVVGVNVAGNTYLKTATPNKQILINNDGIISLTSSNFVEALANNHVRLATDNASVKADENNGVIIEVDSDNPKTLTLKPNGDFEVSNGHTLKFDTTGSITIDGQPIGGGGGGGTQLYQHYIKFSTGNVITGYLSFISSDNTSITSFATLNQFLRDRGLNAWSSAHVCSGIYTGNPNVVVIGIYSSGANEITLVVQKPSAIVEFTPISSLGSVVDTIITL